jgi:phage shock protein PspC (stress-responsive transcriptional regulator)
MHKRIYRSPREKMLGGVAGGLAEYFDIDPTIVRIVFVLSVFAGGIGVPAYIIMWIIIPMGPLEQFNMPAGEHTPNAGTTPPNSGTPTPDSETGTYNQSSAGPDPVSTYFESVKKHKERKGIFLGSVLIIFGVILLAENLFDWIDFHHIFPLILVAFGIGLLLNAFKK